MVAAFNIWSVVLEIRANMDRFRTKRALVDSAHSQCRTEAEYRRRRE